VFARSSRLSVERLDDRNAPSSLTGNDVASPSWMPDQTTPANWAVVPTDPSGGQTSELAAANQKPQIVNFSVNVNTGGVATFSGTVRDDQSVSGLTVTLTGLQNCLTGGKTVTTDADGNFSWQAAVRPSLDAGWAFADVTDSQGLPAEQNSCWVNC